MSGWDIYGVSYLLINCAALIYDMGKKGTGEAVIVGVVSMTLTAPIILHLFGVI